MSPPGRRRPEVGRLAHPVVGLLTTVALLAACAGPPTVAPPGLPPGAPLTAHDRFHAAPAGAPRPAEADLRWWRRFDDPALADWVERALAANPDLQRAGQRAAEARALLRGAMAARGPSLGAEARIDADTRPAGDTRRVSPSLSLRFDWDADLWGGLASQERAASARALAGEHRVQAARLSTAALTARAYLGWRESLLSEDLLMDAIALQREIARLVQLRVDAGLSPRLDALRARGELAATEAAAAEAAEASRAAARALQQLAGEWPGAPLSTAEPVQAPVRALLQAPAPLPRLQGAAPLTLPVDLLRLRPDLRAAEQDLRATQAERDVADAARRPSLRLPGVLTLGSTGGGAVLGTLAASVAAVAAAPLFDGGQRKAERDAAQTRVRAAELVWQSTLLQALSDVEAALTAAESNRRRQAAQGRALAQADEAVQHARTLYTAGLAGFGDVLDAQRSALERRQALLRMQGDAARASVSIFEALGLVDAPARAAGS
jgi:NodT family efflux transporter outer membrane factor (OMF) lipoprotein